MKHDFIFSPYMGKVLGDLLTLAKFHTENYGNSFILSLRRTAPVSKLHIELQRYNAIINF